MNQNTISTINRCQDVKTWQTEGQVYHSLTHYSYGPHMINAYWWDMYSVLSDPGLVIGQEARFVVIACQLKESNESTDEACFIIDINRNHFTAIFSRILQYVGSYYTGYTIVRKACAWCSLATVVHLNLQARN